MRPYAETVAVEHYRDLMSAFPTGVGVITTVDCAGEPRGLTCSSLASVTLDPPTLLVCLHSRSGTLDALCTRGAFLVNLLHAKGQRAAEVFSLPGGDRFARIAWLPSPGSGLPMLTGDAFAFAECRVAGTQVVGDHTVVFGEVASVRLEEGDVPLLYGLRRFSTWFGR